MFRFFSKSSAHVNEEVVPQLVRAEGVTKSLTEKLRLLEEERIKEKERAAKAVQLKSKMIAVKSAIKALDAEVKDVERRLDKERELSDNLEGEVMAEAMVLDAYLDMFDEAYLQIGEPVDDETYLQIGEPIDDGVTFQSFQEYVNIPE
jgi:hypothetical protein